jgi:hypothetical protein
MQKCAALPALARLLTQVENDTPEGRFKRVVSIPGGRPDRALRPYGKIIKVNQLARHYRHVRMLIVAVGIVCILQPLHGGAIRRSGGCDQAGDPGFSSTDATRARWDGPWPLAAVSDAAGFDVI